MARCAFIVGGTGQIGRATALDLLSAGWEVTVSHRGSSPVPGVLLERGAKISVLDRNTPGALAATLGSGANLLIDAMWHSMRRMRASLRRPTRRRSLCGHLVFERLSRCAPPHA